MFRKKTKSKEKKAENKKGTNEISEKEKEEAIKKLEKSLEDCC